MIVPDNKYKLFTKVVLAMINQYVTAHQKGNDGEVPDVLLKVSTKGFAVRAINGFTDKEVETLMEIEKDPEFKEIKSREISYLIMSLIILKKWVELVPKNQRPIMNISDKKMSIGKAQYAIHMLKAKQLKPEMYEKEKGIIEETETTANDWFAYFQNRLLQENEDE